jgi:ABC-2 type transport system permease protein
VKKILIVETKLHLREWPTMFFSIGLPLFLLLIIGQIPGLSEPDPKLHGERLVDTQLPSQMTLLAVLTLACSVLPAVLVSYRERGVLRRMSTTPASPGRLLASQLVINLAIGFVSAILLVAGARVVLGSAVPKQLAGFVLVFLLGSAALLALGLLIASVAPSAKAAQGIGSLVMFPLMFVSGMWIPREFMPSMLRRVSDFSVAGPFAQALRDTWAGHAPQLMHLAVIAGGLLLFGGLSVRLFRWE